ncbi:hypothetical protein [Opitutus sp. ER46]|uniref:hypothetical protein n=1 Tax=Opitutus sp. ER46 TaxID=2161864 RepID=UPI001E64687F|nr:hypothetical protein [Opitutus sp. ER46]
MTKETPKVRWLLMIAAWLAVGTMAWLHSAYFDAHREMLDRTGTRGPGAPTTPLQRVVPTMYADTQMWVRHALAVTEGEGPRIRFTHADNAPQGREVHWSSAITWALAGEGRVASWVTGKPVALSIEDALSWFNLPLFMACVVGFSAWVARRAGAGAGVFLAFAMIGANGFYGGFGPLYVDHHGILAAAVLGLVLGAMFMGVGFWRATDEAAQFLPRSAADARRAAVFSAVCGGVGLWFSAATLTPAIAIVGFAGVAAMALFGRPSAGVQCDPGIWRLWGRVGGAMSLGFYLLEYAPFHLGWRLEVNHPAYALAWWGGSEIIAQFAAWRAGLPAAQRGGSRWLIAALVAVAVAPTIVLVGGARTFVVFDPFISRLSKFVAEGLPIGKAIQFFGLGRYIIDFIWMGVALLAAVVAWWRCRGADRIVIVFSALATGAFSLMALAQLRWGASASGPLMGMVIIGVASLAGARWRWLRWAVLAAAIGGLTLPTSIGRITQIRHANEHRVVDKIDALQPLYRDIAAVLRATQPTGQLTVLGSPNASVAIGYYGRFQTIGTLYWENLDGTKAAAEIFSAQTELEARRRMRERGITHVAMIMDENFLAEYYELLAPDPATSSLAQSFGRKLLIDLQVPYWLEEIPYQMPPNLPYQPQRVLLFQTRFSPVTEAEKLYEDALADFAADRVAAGDAKLDAALARQQGSSELWVAKTNRALQRGEAVVAKAAAERAYATAEPGRRFTLCTGLAARFYQAGAHEIAAQLFRAALEVRQDAATMNNLAWLLATSRQDAVRDPAAALALTDRLAEFRGELVFLNARAAALAANGRFEEAVAVGAQALESAQKAGDAGVTQLNQKRLQAYRAGQPWRE